MFAFKRHLIFWSALLLATVLFGQEVNATKPGVNPNQPAVDPNQPAVDPNQPGLNPGVDPNQPLMAPKAKKKCKAVRV